MTQQWKTVPVEPTEAMVIEGVNAGLSHKDEPYFIYAAMLAAAPAAPASAQDDAKDELTRGRIEEIAHEVYKAERFTKDDEVWHNLFWLTSFAKAIEKELRRSAPAAGDARELLEALKKARRELHACQAVIHLAGGFDPAYVTGAQAAIRRADAAIAASQQQEG